MLQMKKRFATIRQPAYGGKQVTRYLNYEFKLEQCKGVI
jgi:hypothetical protein